MRLSPPSARSSPKRASPSTPPAPLVPTPHPLSRSCATPSPTRRPPARTLQRRPPKLLRRPCPHRPSVETPLHLPPRVGRLQRRCPACPRPVRCPSSARRALRFRRPPRPRHNRFAFLWHPKFRHALARFRTPGGPSGGAAPETNSPAIHAILPRGSQPRRDRIDAQ